MSRFRKLALIVSTVALTVAAAAPFPASIPLPVDFQPEGIATGPKATFYAGSLTTGDIYRGSLRTGKGAIFVDAPPGRQAAGMKVERSTIGCGSPAARPVMPTSTAPATVRRSRT